MTMLGLGWLLEIYLSPPLTVLVTKDIFDLSKNKMTNKERVLIAEKVIDTFVNEEDELDARIRELDKLIYAQPSDDDCWWDEGGCYSNDNYKLRNELDDLLDERRRKSGRIQLGWKSGRIQLREAEIYDEGLINICIDDEGITFDLNIYAVEEYAKGFCERHTTPIGLCNYGSTIKCWISMPQIQDDYFECYFKALLNNAYRIYCDIWSEYNTYVRYMEK